MLDVNVVRWRIYFFYLLICRICECERNEENDARNGVKSIFNKTRFMIALSWFAEGEMWLHLVYRISILVFFYMHALSLVLRCRRNIFSENQFLITRARGVIEVYFLVIRYRAFYQTLLYHFCILLLSDLCSSYRVQILIFLYSCFHKIVKATL